MRDMCVKGWGRNVRGPKEDSTKHQRDYGRGVRGSRSDRQVDGREVDVGFERDGILDARGR